MNTEIEALEAEIIKSWRLFNDTAQLLTDRKDAYMKLVDERNALLYEMDARADNLTDKETPNEI